VYLKRQLFQKQLSSTNVSRCVPTCKLVNTAEKLNVISLELWCGLLVLQRLYITLYNCQQFNIGIVTITHLYEVPNWKNRTVTLFNF